MPPKKNVVNFSSSDEDSSEFESCSKSKRAKMEKGSHDYKHRRERNNVAVRKSRAKSRLKAKETVEKVNRLRQENELLEQKVQILSKELSVLKDLFLAHAGTVAEGNCSVATKTAVQSDHKYSATPKVPDD